MNLTDALAEAHGRIVSKSHHPDWDTLFEWHRDEVDEEKTHLAFSAILADPAFREALTQALIEHFFTGTGPDEYEEWWTTPRHLAESVIADLLPEVTP